MVSKPPRKDWVIGYRAGGAALPLLKQGDLSSLSSPALARIRTLAYFLLFSLGFSFNGMAEAFSAELPEAVARVLDNHAISRDSLGLYVRDVASETPLLTVNSTVAMNPASVMKTVTTLAGLNILGPDYQWETRVFVENRPTQGMVDNLYFVPGGDPFLVTERFWELLRRLRAMGLEKITGDLVVDRRFFTPPPNAHPGDFDGQPWRVYNVLPDAGLVNFHASRFLFTPMRNRVRIEVDPPSARLVIENRVQLIKASCGRALRLHHQIIDALPSRRIRFTGTYPSGCRRYEMLRSVLPASDYLHALFSHLWHQLGGAFSGTVRYGEVPEGAVVLAKHNSEPLSVQVRRINKLSNNVMARHLLLTLGVEAEGFLQDFQGGGALERGRETITHWLRHQDVSMGGFYIDNGSGLSREARISAQTLGELLWGAYHSARMPEFISTLPIVGVDGTMGRRLLEEPVAGQAHVKTGLLQDVRAMAGYMLTANQRRLVFVSLHNHPGIDRGGVGTLVQDRFLLWLYRL